MKEFNVPNLKILREEIVQALAEIAKKHGIDMKLANMSYNDNSFTSKIEAAIVSEDGAQSVEEANFARYAAKFGLKPSDFGKEITVGNRTYVISGIKQRSRKYPIIMTRTDTNGSYKFDTYSVLQAMGRD